jgi:hypothetical protein
MAEVVNLRTARKRRARETNARVAAASRASHGVSRKNKKLATTIREVSQRKLDQHKIEPGERQ